jgi:hypothetical protein
MEGGDLAPRCQRQAPGHWLGEGGAGEIKIRYL